MNILAIVLGLITWSSLIYSIVKRKYLTQEKVNKLRLQAWISCTISIYIPSIILSNWAKNEYVSSLLDCTFGYHFGASILLAVTVIMTILSFVLCRQSN